MTNVPHLFQSGTYRSFFQRTSNFFSLPGRRISPPPSLSQFFSPPPLKGGSHGPPLGHEVSRSQKGGGPPCPLWTDRLRSHGRAGAVLLKPSARIFPAQFLRTVLASMNAPALFALSFLGNSFFRPAFDPPGFAADGRAYCS